MTDDDKLLAIVASACARSARRAVPAACGLAALAGAAAMFAGGFQSALAGPSGGTVVGGAGSISRPDAATTVIRQQSGALAIDWRAFDVAGHERVQFQQPSTSAAVLNRVLNQRPSQIFGTIQANGQVFIMNPSGVVFGAGARVEVGGLFASSLDISVDDFMDGHYAFEALEGTTPGAVINRGLIRAATGGGVSLVGGAVHNEGLIVAELGHVHLAAGRRAVLDFDGDGLIRFEVDGAVLDDVAGLESAVANTGEIRADGGQVLLEAAVAREVFDRAINSEGIIVAGRIEGAGGSVRLAAEGGDVVHTGDIDVSSRSADGVGGGVRIVSDAGIEQRGRIRADGDGGGGEIAIEAGARTLLDGAAEISARATAGQGGRVTVLGEQVALLGETVIDVSGGFGGGEVLVGGDYQGANPAVRNASRAGVGADVFIRADALETGDGGRIIVWADETTTFLGQLSARGGTASGDGGFAEVSGKASLAYRGSADLRAPAGERGTLLLDPRDIVIKGGSGDGDGDGKSGSFDGEDSDLAGSLLLADDGPSIIFESEIERQSETADIVLQARRSISVDTAEFDHDSGHPGDTPSGTLALAPGASLVMETRNRGGGEAGNINLIGGFHGTDLSIVTSTPSGAAPPGDITIRTGVGGDRSTPMLLPNLVSARDITINAGGGTSSVLIFGTVSAKRNVDIDATGSVTVFAGERIIGGGDGTAVTIDAAGITLFDGAPGAETVSNGGTGSVALTSTGATSIVLGESAVGAGVGLLSLTSGKSIVAINLTDVADVTNEINAAGPVSLAAAEDIGAVDRHIEIKGVTDLALDAEGSFHVSGSDGAGGIGAPLTGFSLTLHPDDAAGYTLENFAGQVFGLAADPAGDLIIGTLSSTTVLEVDIATRDDGILIGTPGAGGIDLAGASDVTLWSAAGINERDSDDGGVVVEEIVTDGLVSLTAASGIGDASLLDVAAAAAGSAAILEASTADGGVRVRSRGPLTVAGGGIAAAGGGRIEASGTLRVDADVTSDANLELVAVPDGASLGNDVIVADGTRVALSAAAPAEIMLSAGDDVVLDGGRVETDGAATHRVLLEADAEAGGADGHVGAVVQSTAGTSVVAPRLDIDAGGGIGAAAPLEVVVEELAVANSTSGDVRLESRGDVLRVGDSRNDAAGGDLALTAVDGDLALAGTLDAGGDSVTLGAAGTITQSAGAITAGALVTTSGGATSLGRATNALGSFSATAGGDVGLENSTALALGAVDTGDNDLAIDNATSLTVAGLVDAGTGKATLRTASGDIDGAGGVVTAGDLVVDAAGGIGRDAALRVGASGRLDVRSRGVGSDGDIDLRVEGDLATSRLDVLATHTGSRQSVKLATTGILDVDSDPIDTPDLQEGDTLELGGARVDLGSHISGADVGLRFTAPVTVKSGEEVRILLRDARLTFDGNVSPGPGSTLSIESPVAFAAGSVSGGPDSTLVVEDALELVTDTTIRIDNLRLSGNPSDLTGSGDLTLLPATHGADLVIGGASGLAPAVTVTTLHGFGGGALGIGAPADPTSASPLAGNVRVTTGLDAGGAVLTVGGLGDVRLENNGDPLASRSRVNVVAVGDGSVFPGLVSHGGGDIVDADPATGAAPVIDAPSVRLIAQGEVGRETNALEVRVGSGGEVGFVTGADNAFVNTSPGSQRVVNVAGSSPILDAFQALGFFGGPLSLVALGRPVGLETTGLETTGLAEIGYLDEGLFLLPNPFTMPAQATLVPALMDPAFPGDRRPEHPDAEADWEFFYEQVLREYVESRYALPESASEAERGAANERLEREWALLVAYFERIRANERAALAAAPGAARGGS